MRDLKPQNHENEKIIKIKNNNQIYYLTDKEEVMDFNINGTEIGDEKFGNKITNKNKKKYQKEFATLILLNFLNNIK